MNQQLSLPIHQIDDETLENFYSDNNALLLNSLRQNMTDLQQQFFYLWGSQSVGKTHLLRALCNEYIQQQRSAIYVPLSKSQYFSTAVFENLEQQELVCLDDLQTIIGNSEWEIALFDLFNRIKANGKTLLVVSADQSPTASSQGLPASYTMTAAISSLRRRIIAATRSINSARSLCDHLRHAS